MSAVSDTAVRLAGAATTPHHPAGRDVTYLPEPFEGMSELADVGTAVLDRGAARGASAS